MLHFHQDTLTLLHEKFDAIVDSFSEAAIASRGDFSMVEEAAHTTILEVRRALMSAGLTLSSDESRQTYQCPVCSTALRGWKLTPRQVVTAEGEATYSPVRYRCVRCGEDHYPLEEANGLCGSQFTTGAQGLIAEAAAHTAFGYVSRWLLSERALPVSAKEVDRTAREVSDWRAEEEEQLTTAVFGEAAARMRAQGQDPIDAAANLGGFEGWKEQTPAQISVDGAMVRSPDRGADGTLEWFEHRAGLIRPAREEDPGEPTYIGGVCSPDELFDLLASVWRKSGQVQSPVLFLADGARWIWDRVRLYFPSAIEVLDIYHAAEHVASAGNARWGEGTQEAQRWRARAREMLLEPGGTVRVLRTLVAALRQGVAEPQALRREIAYLYGHRHRMKYHALRKRGLPTGSGAMESAIKQLNTQRLRLPGMKWTREGADAILRIRAACLSGTFRQTVRRRHQALTTQAKRYCMAA